MSRNPYNAPGRDVLPRAARPDMPHGRLPVPRVRDGQGWTWELFWFLRGNYRLWLCESYRSGCDCEECRIDTSLNRVWEGRQPVTEPWRKNSEQVILGSSRPIDGNRWNPSHSVKAS